jgi:beta-N-acetylhexosaminidase
MPYTILYNLVYSYDCSNLLLLTFALMWRNRRKSRLWVAIIAIAVLPLLSFTWPSANKPSLPSFFQSSGKSPRTTDPKLGTWARLCLDSMTLDEKIGQLFMVAAYSNKDAAHEAAIERLIRDEKIGGLIFMQGGPGRQIALANRFQNAARFPLLFSQDSEWGLGMRLDSTISFPKNMTLGAIRDSMPIFEMGMQVGKECRRVGVHVNFAPVVDINNNPRNPVINDRSFGENRENVFIKGLFMYKGLEYSGTIGCIKHFPGHGDTDTDSHADLPLIPFTRQRLDSLELYPYRKLFERGVASIMIAHLYIPVLDNTPNLASTLSKKIVTDLLRNELGFKGLTFTDALGMQGVAKYWGEGETELKALMAGNDVLLFSANVAKAKKMIKDAITKGQITVAEIDKHVLKILIAKEWCGLHTNRLVPQVLPNEMMTANGFALRKQLFQAAITCVKNDHQLLPLGKLAARKIAVIEVGASAGSQFQQHLKTYAKMDFFQLPAVSEKAARDKVLAQIANYNTVIVGVDGMSKSASKNFGISEGTKALMKELDTPGREVIAVLFGSPYGLKDFGKSEDAILVAYENKDDALVAAAEAIFGGIGVDGILPVTASAQFRAGASIQYPSANRFQFGLPEAAGMDSHVLQEIDVIAQEAISAGATPGCAVLVMRGNKIVWDKGYGRTEYSGGGKAVDPYSTLYDLASVTKVCATTVATMKMYYDKQVDIEESASAYVSEMRGRNLNSIKIRNLLLHNSGLVPFIPFYQDTYTSAGLKPGLYSSVANDTFCVPIIDGLYMCGAYKDTVWTMLMNSPVKNDHKMRYSDLSMIVMRRVLEGASGIPFEKYLDSVFYKPLGMDNTCFNPAIKMPKKTCAPTEMDNLWRHKKVQGYVHDQSAAILGGVSGNAGLFSNIYDIAKLLLMVKNGGSTGDQQYFDSTTVKYFTSRQQGDNRRGLGWDKADPVHGSSCSDKASALTYGHLGFTGICVWVDPRYDLVYIFLSNRTWPDAENKKLQQMDIRNRILDKVYEAIHVWEKRENV